MSVSDEAARYLSAVDAFRELGCDPFPSKRTARLRLDKVSWDSTPISFVLMTRSPIDWDREGWFDEL